MAARKRVYVYAANLIGRKEIVIELRRHFGR